MVAISQQLFSDKIKCPRLYYCFQEAGDMVMCKSIEEATGLDKQQIDLSPSRLSFSDLARVPNKLPHLLISQGMEEA